MKKFLKFLIGLVMLPVCYGYSMEFLWVISAVYKNPGTYWGLFAAGGATYLLIYIILPKPLFLYIFGHELTHAFFAKLFGWKIKSMNISRSGGHVKLSGSNSIVTLAPYFFPFYSFIVLFLYIFAILLGDDRPLYPYFIFLTGFTLLLHILMTMESLKASQPDINEGGMLFSLPFIYLGNLIVITLLLRLTVFKSINYLGFLKMGWIRNWGIWKALFRAIPS